MKHNRFTLVELLVVICIASLLMGVVLPAFNRLVTGSAVDRLASNLKLRLERAQSHAASSRRHVALLLPNGATETNWTDDSTDPGIKKARLGGSKMCYVDNVVVSGTPEVFTSQFGRWLPDEDWTDPERGALLVAVSSTSPVDSDGNLTVAKCIAHNGILTGDILNGSGKARPLKEIQGVKFTAAATAKTVSDCAVIFSPKGGIRSGADVYLVIAEAVSDGDKVLFPGGQINNFRVLRIDRLTGKVEYYR